MSVQSFVNEVSNDCGKWYPLARGHNRKLFIKFWLKSDRSPYSVLW
jgi:hypothetical protein